MHTLWEIIPVYGFCDNDVQLAGNLEVFAQSLRTKKGNQEGKPVSSHGLREEPKGMPGECPGQRKTFGKQSSHSIM